MRVCDEIEGAHTWDVKGRGVASQIIANMNKPWGEAASGSTHSTAPEEIALLAESIYGRCAPIIIVTMTGADFSLGERFSPIIASHISHVCEVVRQIYAHGLPR